MRHRQFRNTPEESTMQSAPLEGLLVPPSPIAGMTERFLSRGQHTGARPCPRERLHVGRSSPQPTDGDLAPLRWDLTRTLTLKETL
jgi:hypothetical protein